jgi:hypothetical protein
MIIHTTNDAVIVVNDCHWTPGAWLAVSAGTVVTPAELDQLIDELTRIRDAIADRTPKEEAA